MSQPGLRLVLCVSFSGVLKPYLGCVSGYWSKVNVCELQVILNRYSIKMNTIYYIFIYLPSERIYLWNYLICSNLLRMFCDNFEKYQVDLWVMTIRACIFSVQKGRKQIISNVFNVVKLRSSTKDSPTQYICIYFYNKRTREYNFLNFTVLSRSYRLLPNSMALNVALQSSLNCSLGCQHKLEALTADKYVWEFEVCWMTDLWSFLINIWFD